jgi:hypothetical protein
VVLRQSSYRGIESALARELYRSRRLRLWSDPVVALDSRPDEDLAAFRQRVALARAEERDRGVEQLRERFAQRLEQLENKIRTAEERLGSEQAQAQEKRWGTVASVGTTVLGALLGRKKISVTNVSRAGTTLRSFSRTRKEQDDVVRASGRLEDLIAERAELASQAQSEVDALVARWSAPGELAFEEVSIAPLKSDIEVREVLLVWRPGVMDVDGRWQALDVLHDGSR